MTKEQEEAEIILQNLANINTYIDLYDDKDKKINNETMKKWKNASKIMLNLIQEQQAEIEKKENIIDEMAECIGQDIKCVRPEIERNKMTHDCKECIKQYFERKVKE